MTAPAYNHDLTDVDLAQNTTGWNQWGAGGNIALGSGADFAIHNGVAVDGKIGNTEKGIYYDNGAGISLGAGDHLYVWLNTSTPGVTDSLANRGACVGLGSSSTAFVKYHVEGNDSFGVVGRVAKCYPIDYSVRTQNTGGAPYRTVTGSPSADPRVLGGYWNVNSSVKSNNMAVDAIRYGTGAYLTAGELLAAGDASDDPCTLSGFQSLNDDTTNAWGILTLASGAYELQGAFVIGQNSSGVATLARFKDSDQAISVVDTPHSASDFSKIVIDHASTRAELTNINIKALGTNNRGLFDVTANNPTVIIDGGTWTDIGAVTFRSNTTIDGLTLRRTDTVTSNGSAITNALFDQCRAAKTLIAANLNEVSSSQFISDGSNNAVELTGAAATYSWDNTLSGYDAGVTGNGVEVTGGLVTGNEAIHITATTGTFNISVADGASVPSVSSAGAIVNVTANQITIQVTVLDDDTGSAIGTTSRVYLVRSSDKSVLLNGAVNGVGVISTQIDYDADTNVEGWARDMDLSGDDYIPADISGQYTASGFSIIIRLKKV